MKIQLLRKAFLGVAVLMAVFVVPLASADAPIKINAWGIHYGGQMVYRYQIENNSASIIAQVALGLNSPGKELPGKPWSLNPNYSDVPTSLDLAQCKPFTSMTCEVTVFQFDYMAKPKTNIFMTGIENGQIPPPKVFSGAENIRPGTLSSVAEITVPTAYQSTGYLTAFGEVYLLDDNTKNPDGTVVTSVEIPFTKVDVTPPNILVTLSPAMLWPPNGKLVSVNATVKVQDDYDPDPEIKLESITANETLDPDDIQNAQFGTDDRNFYLAAKRAGTILAGRVYTVTYSATDGSGNKATAAATLTVPHDQGKNKFP